MRNRKAIIPAIALAWLIVSTEATIATENRSGFFLANDPGVAVRYIDLIDSGNGVTGYLETIRAAGIAADRQLRTQTPVRESGTTLVFGTSAATKIHNGYLLTQQDETGALRQQIFTRADPQTINESISALSSAVSRNHARVNKASALAELNDFRALSTYDAAQLRIARTAEEKAASGITAAQMNADRLSALARQMRAAANQTIESPGVSLADNRYRIEAMKRADVAEQNAVAAQRLADLAQDNVAAATDMMARFQMHMALVYQRAAQLAARIVEGNLTKR